MTTRITIPARLSYANIWSPNENDKYSCSLIIEKDEKVLERIEKAIAAAIEQGKNKLANSNGKVPPTIKKPLRDADAEGKEDAAYKGKFWLNATSKLKPQIVDRSVEPILDPDEVYSGCYCNVSVNFYAFSVDGNKGIACGLGNIQKVKDGERLGGGKTAKDEFSSIDDIEFSIA